MYEATDTIVRVNTHKTHTQALLEMKDTHRYKHIHIKFELYGSFGPPGVELTLFRARKNGANLERTHAIKNKLTNIKLHKLQTECLEEGELNIESRKRYNYCNHIHLKDVEWTCYDCSSSSNDQPRPLFHRADYTCLI